MSETSDAVRVKSEAEFFEGIRGASLAVNDLSRLALETFFNGGTDAASQPSQEFTVRAAKALEMLGAQLEVLVATISPFAGVDSSDGNYSVETTTTASTPLSSDTDTKNTPDEVSRLQGQDRPMVDAVKTGPATLIGLDEPRQANTDASSNNTTKPEVELAAKSATSQNSANIAVVSDDKKPERLEPENQSWQADLVKCCEPEMIERLEAIVPDFDDTYIKVDDVGDAVGLVEVLPVDLERWIDEAMETAPSRNAQYRIAAAVSGLLAGQRWLSASLIQEVIAGYTNEPYDNSRSGAFSAALRKMKSLEDNGLQTSNLRRRLKPFNFEDVSNGRPKKAQAPDESATDAAIQVTSSDFGAEINPTAIKELGVNQDSPEPKSDSGEISTVLNQLMARVGLNNPMTRSEILYQLKKLGIADNNRDASSKLQKLMSQSADEGDLRLERKEGEYRLVIVGEKITPSRQLSSIELARFVFPTGTFSRQGWVDLMVLQQGLDPETASTRLNAYVRNNLLFLRKDGKFSFTKPEETPKETPAETGIIPKNQDIKDLAALPLVQDVCEKIGRSSFDYQSFIDKLVADKDFDETTAKNVFAGLKESGAFVEGNSSREHKLAPKLVGLVMQALMNG